MGKLEMVRPRATLNQHESTKMSGRSTDGQK